MENRKSGEREAQKPTIVGGRPPGNGDEGRTIPCGIELMLKKAAVDPEFMERVLDDAEEAASSISLALRPSESEILRSMSREQLETVINKTRVGAEVAKMLRVENDASVMLEKFEEADPYAPCGKAAPQGDRAITHRRDQVRINLVTTPRLITGIRPGSGVFYRFPPRRILCLVVVAAAIAGMWYVLWKLLF